MILSFTTARLNISEIAKDMAVPARIALLEQIPKMLTPSVVANLPPNFHGIDSPQLAEVWLDHMLAESRLLSVKTVGDTLIGFLFVFVENSRDAHIGYLLAEAYWGQGLAGELLQGFIAEVARTEPGVRLIGGVASANIASANLLKKLGFVEQLRADSGVVFYEYTLPQPQP